MTEIFKSFLLMNDKGERYMEEQNLVAAAQVIILFARLRKKPLQFIR